MTTKKRSPYERRPGMGRVKSNKHYDLKDDCQTPIYALAPVLERINAIKKININNN